jgi:uncharacterized protein YndB with AHSA1/START domain
MRRTKARDCRTLPFDVAQVYAALLDFESYARWWPAQLPVRVLNVTPDRVGSRIEVRPRGGWFIGEVGQVIPDREILIEDVEGVHRGTGRWTFEKLGEGSRACYRIDLEPHGWLPRLLLSPTCPKPFPFACQATEQAAGRPCFACGGVGQFIGDTLPPYSKPEMLDRLSRVTEFDQRIDADCQVRPHIPFRHGLVAA